MKLPKYPTQSADPRLIELARTLNIQVEEAKKSKDLIMEKVAKAEDRRIENKVYLGRLLKGRTDNN